MKRIRAKITITLYRNGETREKVEIADALPLEAFLLGNSLISVAQRVISTGFKVMGFKQQQRGTEMLVDSAEAYRRLRNAGENRPGGGSKG